MLSSLREIIDRRDEKSRNFVLPRLEESRERLNEHIRTSPSPSELLSFFEDALDYLCLSKSLHWQAVWGRGPVDSGTPDFKYTLKEYFEEKLGALSVPDYFDLVFRQSRLARSRELTVRMAGMVNGSPELKALFENHPYDKVLYPKLPRSERGKTLLREIGRYLEEFGLISIDPLRDFTRID